LGNLAPRLRFGILKARHADHQSVDGVIANWVGACTAK
jgi:hypothetical protein